MDDKFIWYWLILPYLVLLLAFSGYVFFKLVSYDKPVYVSSVAHKQDRTAASYYPLGPAIQQCDKELWLRVKDGC